MLLVFNMHTVPNAPIIHSVPLYDHGTTHLQSIHTMFEETVSKINAPVNNTPTTPPPCYTGELTGVPPQG